MSYSTLIWLQSSPYNSSAAREALDYILALAAVDCPAQLLLSGPAVCLLQPHADVSAALQLKDCSKLLGLFELYDLPVPLVCQDSLNQYQPEPGQLNQAITLLSKQQITERLARFQHVVTL
ncbi:DsrE family protein [Alkalimonas amylolytica]|uniref:DsrE/DsrF-like family protein n=1 Tax=Alkalimonas amylolytica TaxID=152573 RepID=A0A1H3ZSA1_ALKAM|nr:DsrE family protein [Alkalimonas amylolytica]SEA26579.1 DsrE/DsrF-like family protein [Alkalimonas amylolytica]